jgi:hypothetical protein
MSFWEDQMVTKEDVLQYMHQKTYRPLSYQELRELWEIGPAGKGLFLEAFLQ